jgi:hypothetical protein
MTVRVHSIDEASGPLLVRVRRADGTVDEVYVEEGATIGRGRSCTIAVDSPAVARCHARLARGPGGLSLVCTDGGSVESGGIETTAVDLAPGVVYSLDDVRFECVPGPAVRRRHPDSCPLSRDFRRWRTERLAAFGGMGIVLRGTEVSSGRPVAVKCARRDGEDELWRRTFAREIAALRDLHSPYVVELLGSGRVGCVSFLVMEWVEGRTLRDVIGDESIPFETILDCFRDVCRGLSEIHGRGLVHCDVKPGNVLLQEGRPARLADLGIARSAAATVTNATGRTSGAFR